MLVGGLRDINEWQLVRWRIFRSKGNGVAMHICADSGRECSNQLVLRKTDETDLLQGIAEADGCIAINDHVLRARAGGLGKAKDLPDCRVLKRCGS